MAKIFLTAQNIDIYDDDSLDLFARTGSTSIEQVSKAGASGVILGHPETNDSPEVVKLKLRTVIRRKEGLPSSFLNKNTIMAGESWEDFQNHSPQDIARIISDQLAEIISAASVDDIANFIVGYDPKWGSRGSGHDDAPPPESDLIFKVAEGIRAMLIDKCGESIGSEVPIIYGGRSTPERTLEILTNDNIDGLILGSACNTVQKTKDIIEAMLKIKPNTRKVLHANFKAFNLSDSYEDYVDTFRNLDDNFIIYISPCYADIRRVAEVLDGII